jgi:hypothetical protein
MMRAEPYMKIATARNDMKALTYTFRSLIIFMGRFQKSNFSRVSSMTFSGNSPFP